MPIYICACIVSKTMAARRAAEPTGFSTKDGGFNKTFFILPLYIPFICNITICINRSLQKVYTHTHTPSWALAVSDVVWKQVFELQCRTEKPKCPGLTHTHINLHTVSQADTNPATHLHTEIPI